MYVFDWIYWLRALAGFCLGYWSIIVPYLLIEKWKDGN